MERMLLEQEAPRREVPSIRVVRVEIEPKYVIEGSRIIMD